MGREDLTRLYPNIWKSKKKLNKVENQKLETFLPKTNKTTDKLWFKRDQKRNSETLLSRRQYRKQNIGTKANKDNGKATNSNRSRFDHKSQKKKLKEPSGLWTRRNVLDLRDHILCSQKYVFVNISSQMYLRNCFRLVIPTTEYFPKNMERSKHTYLT